MDDPHLGDAGILVELRFDLFDGGSRAVALVDLDHRPADLLEDGHGAVAIGAIRHHQRLVFVGGTKAAERRLDGESARPLHDDAFITAVAMGEVEKAFSDLRHEPPELDIARAPVGQHRGFHAARGREGTGRQQIGHVFLAQGSVIAAGGGIHAKLLDDRAAK